MRKLFIFTIGFPFLFLGAMTTTALAETAPSVQPNDGFLEQPKAIFMDAPAVQESSFPTLLQQVRAVNLLIHQEDTLPIGSPEYKNAHRLLVSNLRMLERQLYFNPVDLAQFNATSHPARSTIDQTIYSRDGATSTPSVTVNTSNNALGYHQRTGTTLTRRSIIAAAYEQNLLHILAMTQS